ncbi:MAG: RtcB family protein [Deltaproteobacteria bacterium]|nr:RtcB family protein [Deltaproteobacteria bacterium]
MKKRELLNLGIQGERQLDLAISVCSQARSFGYKKAALRKALLELCKNPDNFKTDPLFGDLANALNSDEAEQTSNYVLKQDLHYNVWGDEIDPEALKQMHNACRLPVSVAGALMPDAHLGYGLPIGGVLATDNAVIPYAVGVDIACRVMLTVLDIPLKKFERNRAKFERALEENTRFGLGAKWKPPKSHPVMDEDWNITPLLKSLKNLAWSQLGTSGTGNHFVEFGEFELSHPLPTLEAGRYLALVSHSGSRGSGGRIADHYSKVARAQHKRLPGDLKHLAWLDLTSCEGQEYWQAMELMGRYASANHHLIHSAILQSLGSQAQMQVENHHNFAWKEVHQGRQVVVHRKGATPAGKGVLGYVPGSMVAPGFLVEGLGNPASLNSCSHGAGRRMSRRQAQNSTTWYELKKTLAEHDVTLLSAGLDEAPLAYKDIEAVMRAQSTLVKKLGRFLPKLVKMAPAGEKAED